MEDFRLYTSSPTAATMSATPEGGQPVPLTEMEALESTLRLRHVAPTGPDSLPTYPFVDSDPFVIKDGEVPHLLFSGGCGSFETKVVEGVRLVCVPDFER